LILALAWASGPAPARAQAEPAPQSIPAEPAEEDAARAPGAELPARPLRNEAALLLGGAVSRVQPRWSVPAAVQYAHAILGDVYWLVVRPDFRLNVAPPGGGVGKQSGYGVELGIAWHAGSAGTSHPFLEIDLGLRGYTAPGYGVDGSVRAGIERPLGAGLAVVAAAAAGFGTARIGATSATIDLQVRGELLVGLRTRF
jgi:hypothetical protein